MRACSASELGPIMLPQAPLASACALHLLCRNPGSGTPRFRDASSTGILPLPPLQPPTLCFHDSACHVGVGNLTQLRMDRLSNLVNIAVSVTPMGDACPAIFASARSMHLVYCIPAILLTIVVFVAMTFCRGPISANLHKRAKHGFLALFFAVVLPVCYVMILLNFPTCTADYNGNVDPACTACLGWWYTPLVRVFASTPIIFVFNGFCLGGAGASIYIAYICLCVLRPESKLEPRDLWVAVPICITSICLLGIFGFTTILPFLRNHMRLAREAVPDLSTDAPIAPQQVFSEGATSSLMSNQATPDVCIEAGAPVYVPVLPNGPAEAVSPIVALETQSAPQASSV